MSFRVQYAPHPPQFSLELSLAQLARLDARFAGVRALRARGSLGLAVQDSADLQEAHLTVREGRLEWRGTPGGLDENGLFPGRSPLHGWSEVALTHGLGLDLARAEVREVSGRELGGELVSWRAGVVYAFARVGEEAHPTLVRRLNLGNFFDRLEAEVLASLAFAAVDVVRVHRLGEDGRHLVWRAEPGGPAAPRAEVRSRAARREGT